MTRMPEGKKGALPAGVSLFAAFIDVNNYFQAGTVPAALVGITSSSGASASETEREIRTVTE